MEDILEIYKKPYDKKIPLICMDEQPIQLLSEKRKVIKGTKSHAKRVDYEYERAGTASIFMFCEPLKGNRHVRVRPRRTKIDWAEEVASLIKSYYGESDKILLVCDNLNTHVKGSFYEAFPAEEARKLVERIEIHYTPKHGSWLNIAESELSVMTRQCLRHRRFSKIEEVREQIEAWAEKTNRQQKKVDWQFTTDDARQKLKSIYPKIIS